MQKSRLLLATALASSSLVLLAQPVWAQDAAKPADGDGGEIVVTGTLIQDPNVKSSQPINVTTAAEIELKQSNNAEALLREIPGITPNIGSAVNNGNNGASFVDLRGLGANRNIVLLDGKRLTPAGLNGQVDLNNIPVALVERVDVLTGGAVTTYGADAITGVVNFVTKRNFAGVEAQISDGITEQGDGNTFRTDLTIGANFDDGRGNAVLSIGYQTADPVFQGDRNFSFSNYDSFSGKTSGSGRTVPATFSFQCAGQTAGGATCPAGLLSGRRQIDPATGQALASSVVPFNFNPFNIFQTPFQRFNIFGEARYEISDHVEVYTRALFSKNTVRTIIAPSGVFDSDVLIPLSNPFLPVALRNQFCANQDFDPNTPGIQTLTAAQCAAAAAATNPSDPNYRNVSTNLRRRATEAGPRISDFTTTIFDYRIGARGSITDKIKYDVNASYGQSDLPQTLKNYVLTSRVRQALLATNANTCLTNTNGCVPLNIFGADGSITPAMLRFLTAESTTTVKTSLAQVAATVTGKTGFVVPFANDEVSFAVGGEYRKYKATQRSDLLAKTSGELGGAGAAAPDIDGGYDVYEGIGELVLPLVQDKPFFDNLTLEAGVRYSSYKIFTPANPKFHTTTYKVGGTYEPVRGIKLRGNYSRAVRAPNISELFSPINTGLTNLNFDPCAGSAPVSNATLQAVCLAQGAPATSIGSITAPTGGQANSTTSGSTALRPEKADTFTVGGVFQPEQIPGLSISVDYYNIKIRRAITAPTSQDAIIACFGNLTAASVSDPACTAIRRDPTTGALDGDTATTGGLSQPTTNSGRLATDGIDLIANYSRELGFAKLSLAFNGNYTFRSKFLSVPLGVNRECTGRYSVNCGFPGSSITPKFQWSQRTTLGFNNIDISLLWRHIDSFVQEPLDVSSAFGNGPAYKGPLTPSTNLPGRLDGRVVDFSRIKAANYFDLTTRINVGDHFDFTFGVANLFDRKPPLVGSNIGSTAYNSGNTYPSNYDALGRRYTVSAKLKF